jgi:sugar phosphate permease
MSTHSSYRWVILLFGILAYATSHFSRQNYTGIQKFIQADFQLDRAAIGVLGASFFYAYAIFQMPWGIAADKFGSRTMATLGMLLTAAAMVGFATSQSEQALLLWRAAAGIAGAAAYVSIAGGIARWFPQNERGFSQAAFGGVGGAVGEGAAFFLLPVLAISFAAGWRDATNMVALGIAAVGVLCLAFLRSAPPGQAPTTRTPFTTQMLSDPCLWCFAALFSGFIIGTRLSQAWISVYLADVYAEAHGFETNTAVVAGGVFATVAFSFVGRGLGLPVAGRLSDALVRRGVSRTAVVIAWLLLSIGLFQLLSMRVTALWLLAIVAALTGVAVNCFTLITAAVADTYGPQKTAAVTGFVNMVAQLAGATALAGSGYIGVFMGRGQTGALVEYQGVWLSGVLMVTLATIVGAAIYLMQRSRTAAIAPVQQF